MLHVLKNSCPLARRFENHGYAYAEALRSEWLSHALSVRACPSMPTGHQNTRKHSHASINHSCKVTGSECAFCRMDEGQNVTTGQKKDFIIAASHVWSLTDTHFSVLTSTEKCRSVLQSDMRSSFGFPISILSLSSLSNVLARPSITSNISEGFTAPPPTL